MAAAESELVAPVRMQRAPGYARPASPPTHPYPAAQIDTRRQRQPQVFTFRTPHTGESFTRQVQKDTLVGHARIHAGSLLSEGILGVLMGKVIDQAWVFQIETESGRFWVTHYEQSDLTKDDVTWVEVQLPPVA